MQLIWIIPQTLLLPLVFVINYKKEPRDREIQSLGKGGSLKVRISTFIYIGHFLYIPTLFIGFYHINCKVLNKNMPRVHVNNDKTVVCAIMLAAKVAFPPIALAMT